MNETVSVWWPILLTVAGAAAGNYWMAARYWRRKADLYQGMWLEALAKKPRRRGNLRVEPAPIRAVR